MTFSKKIFLKDVKKSWKQIIKSSLEKINYSKMKEFYLSCESNNSTIFPNYINIFETFKYFDVSETKVVIIGQDCYINSIKKDNIIIPQANGMAFSVSKEHKIPPSLKNIFKELDETVDTFNIPDHGDLSRWVKEENIILLNCALTVEKGKSNSHAKIWQPITDNIIKEISNKTDNVIFLLWGNFAKSKAVFIDKTKHNIITGVHPSPLASNYNKKGTNKSFFGHDYFNRINEYLSENNKSIINWNL